MSMIELTSATDNTKLFIRLDDILVIEEYSKNRFRSDKIKEIYSKTKTVVTINIPGTTYNYKADSTVPSSTRTYFVKEEASYIATFGK